MIKLPAASTAPWASIPVQDLHYLQGKGPFERVSTLDAALTRPRSCTPRPIDRRGPVSGSPGSDWGGQRGPAGRGHTADENKENMHYQQLMKNQRHERQGMRFWRGEFRRCWLLIITSLGIWSEELPVARKTEYIIWWSLYGITSIFMSYLTGGVLLPIQSIVST